MLQYIFITIICFLFHVFSYAQNVEIYGYIFNSNTGDKIIGAYIYDSISNECATSNVDGYYSLKLKKNSRL